MTMIEYIFSLTVIASEAKQSIPIDVLLNKCVNTGLLRRYTPRNDNYRHCEKIFDFRGNPINYAFYY